ncbi:hypothetical protein QYE76_057494 [Lolium multiflorum]|uniref:Uncharacterized protein n=1 Tax=Lolium multiflorum TaxID=4521 RepID=A0AAD8T4I9_LOLMU|nr:hypothetical protein QYE76_057494 [Lolium multiflorum]
MIPRRLLCLQMDPCTLFLLEDSSSSSDSDLEELLDDDMEQTAVILAAKEILDVRPKKSSLNDINVLHKSHLLSWLAKGDSPTCNYTINGREYTMGYYLADGIYPDWATFVKIIREPGNRAESEFAKAQEAAQKDIERAFGVLQARFTIVRGLARFWDMDTLDDIMTSNVILHNMIIEDERGLNL